MSARKDLSSSQEPYHPFWLENLIALFKREWDKFSAVLEELNEGDKKP